jgi:hypothetical protein
MKRLIPILFLFLLLLHSCSMSEDNLKDEAMKALYKNNLILTDELVVKYCNVYKKLKADGPAMLEQLNKNGGNPQASVDQFIGFERTIREGGFESYAEFVKTNAKIAWAFSISQAGGFMNDMDSMKTDAEKQIAEALKNPDLPKEARDELEKNLAVIRETYAKNSKWANFSMDLIKRIVSDEDLKIIKRHEKELLEAFTGVPMPEPPKESW